VPILSKTDMQWIQSFLNAAQCPRDIGRIPRKLESLSQVKASEWMNFFGIFAVPIMRELMRAGHQRLQAEHLEIFILMQHIVTKLREYAITEAEIDTLHQQLFDVTRLLSLAAAFLDDEGSITPNMHLSLHLRRQLLDNGPAATCWTAPFERINGLLGRFPLNRAMPAESTAARANKMVAAAGACYQEPEIVRFVGGGRFEAPRQNAAAPTSHDTWLRNKQGHVRMHYQWSSLAAFNEFRARRCGAFGAVEAHEAFPGCLRMSNHRSRPRLIHLRRNGELVTGSPHSAVNQDFRYRPGRAPSEELLKQHVPVDHVLQCLHVHYLETRKEDILKLITDAGLSAKKAKAEKTALSDTSSSVALRQAALENQYVQQFFNSLEPTIRMYDSLVMAGETYGSFIGRNHRSSFVAVAFPDPDSADHKTVLWHGQVSYYISHHYDGVAHFFAVCRWYLWPGQKRNGGITAQTAMERFYKDIHPSPLCKKSFAAFPVLSTEFNPTHLQDVVPVQCISHRWIPGNIPAAPGGGRGAAASEEEKEKKKKLQLAYPVPTRVHA